MWPNPGSNSYFAQHWNVWDCGSTNADPSADKPSPNFSFAANAYTATLRSLLQGDTDGNDKSDFEVMLRDPVLFSPSNLIL